MRAYELFIARAHAGLVLSGGTVEKAQQNSDAFQALRYQGALMAVLSTRESVANTSLKLTGSSVFCGSGRTGSIAA